MGAMLPMQGPGVPVTNPTFSSSVSCATKSAACANASSQPLPVALAADTDQHVLVISYGD